MKKELYLNNVSSMIYQICSVIVGLILPRLILKKFGSEVNGIVTSITQMLSVVSMLDLGVGAVVQSALYRPLAENNLKKISDIYNSSNKYFTFIAKILIVYVGILCLYYGLFKKEVFSWQFTSTLILVIAISFFGQYYFGISNTLLLNADQKIYIVTLINLASIIINALVTVFFIKIDANIQIVKLSSSCIFFMRPVLLQYYVKSHYALKRNKKPPQNAIPNQWSGLIQHIAVSLTGTIDNIVLTFLGTFSMLSIYNVYVLPLNSIRNLVEVTSNNYKSFFGNLIARNEVELLRCEFEKYETIMHFLTTVVMSTVLVVLTPFVLVYTEGVNDANYKNTLFCIIITFAYTMYILRIIYSNIIFAAGKFKETQLYCIVECVINIILSFGLVKPLGLEGVAIGTMVSSGYRMIVSAYYLKKDILYRPMRHLRKHLTIDAICIFIIMFIASFIKIKTSNFLWWTLYSAIIFILSFSINVVVYWIFYRKQLKYILLNLLNKLIHIKSIL